MLADPTTFSEVLARLGRYVTVDDDLTSGALLRLATSVRLRGDQQDVVPLQVPLAGSRGLPMASPSISSTWSRWPS